MRNKDITFCGVFRNCQNNVRRVLDLATELCGEVVIAVQESDDNTYAVCRDYNIRILKHPAQSPEESKDEIMSSVKTPWSFWLDDDEFPSLELIKFASRLKGDDFEDIDGIRVPRINYINGEHIEANTDKDTQFRFLRKHVRWNPEYQGRRIHIHPLVRKDITIEPVLYHHRTLEKIERSTARWNELEPQTERQCNQYLIDVKTALSNSKKLREIV